MPPLKQCSLKFIHDIISYTKERKNSDRKMFQTEKFLIGLNWVLKIAGIWLLKIVQRFLNIFQILMARMRSFLQENISGKLYMLLDLSNVKTTSNKLEKKEKINLIFKIRKPKLKSVMIFLMNYLDMTSLLLRRVEALHPFLLKERKIKKVRI